VIHDRLVPAPILELARREAIVIEVGKTPHGPSWKQEDIDALLVEHALGGAHVARLKSGDPGMFGRLDEEMDALDAAGVPFEVIPGITSAAAAAASIKVSMTRRGRNKSVQFITGHDMQGFAEHDWRSLAAEGATAAIYMGVRAARFIQGRLMMHGAGFDTPVTAIENASRPEQKIVSATLGTLPRVLKESGITGPAILFLGLSPREALNAATASPDLHNPNTAPDQRSVTTRRSASGEASPQIGASL
jgi:uroporphyrin-III C-methyltransferase/precorrin-2 dehydrogenase/sirohydrochlorin ferrochelatase